MMSFKSAVKLLGVGVAAAAIATGCVSSKAVKAPEEMAEAPEEAAPAATPPSNDWYTVVAGDCLWCISEKAEIYGDPYKWPLIYRINKAQIKDADLIFPGQNLEIDRNLTPSLVANATKHARERGAWSLGVTEDSDVAFLEANP